MSELIKQPKIELLEQLRPFNEEEMLTIAQANMAVKVNYFDYSGIVICVSFRHVVVDASATAYFVRNWAKVASVGSLIDIKNHVVFDCTSIFPSQDVSSMSKGKPDANDEDITKWKLNPPLPEQCIGNAITIGMTTWPTKKRAGYNKIVFKVREMLSMVEENVKNRFPNGCKNYRIDHAALDRDSAMKVLNFRGTFRLPFYQTGFGWGKPVWFSPGQQLKNNNFVLLDTSDGKGLITSNGAIIKGRHGQI
ncbi:hypothetical protein Ddye_004898 [Dipteronia dyeriana]|uniref:Uncharacterized protein n=1 Tax=Dipteronia dyeriana TaxID=168575 RepID=A0AAD9XF36_9ROSI|nr:hypothetical protein Ddye_004898 [Dipteronia dyeriana]